MPQTSPQVTNTIRFGSGIFEIGDDVNSLVNVGAIRGAKFAESFDKVTVKSDNAGTVYEGIAKHEASFEAELLEINLDIMAKYLDGVADVSVVAGTPVSVTNESHVLTGTTSERLTYGSADGSEATSIVVKNSGGTTTYVLNTDYTVAVDDAGFTTIARIAGGAITSAQTVKVNYTYTPAAHRVYTSGGLTQLTAKVARFTNTNPATGKKFQITIWKATADNGLAIDFVGDEDSDVNAAKVKITGTCDTTRTAGAQLFEIIDEQHATA